MTDSMHTQKDVAEDSAFLPKDLLTTTNGETPLDEEDAQVGNMHMRPSCVTCMYICIYIYIYTHTHTRERERERKRKRKR